MTRETRNFIEFADIVGIEFQCPSCKATAIHNVADGFNVPNWCGNCRKDWIAERSGDEHIIKAFISALDTVKRLGANRRMRLEIREDSEPADDQKAK